MKYFECEKDIMNEFDITKSDINGMRSSGFLTRDENGFRFRTIIEMHETFLKHQKKYWNKFKIMGGVTL